MCHVTWINGQSVGIKELIKIRMSTHYITKFRYLQQLFMSIMCAALNNEQEHFD